jgi:hypothetical protein
VARRPHRTPSSAQKRWRTCTSQEFCAPTSCR